MADKFVRLAASEGDTFYATTANSLKSIESLEDNIDDKMVGFIGSDVVGGSIASSITETKIGEVIVAANSARNRLLIIAGVRLQALASSTADTTTFRIRTGTSATATSNTQRISKTLQQNTDASGTGAGVVGAILMASVTSSDETFTGQIYVHVTGENNVSNANIAAICDFVYVLGI